MSKNTSKLKIFMLHSQNSGVGMWRMIHPAKWLNKLGLAEVKTLPFYWRTHGDLTWDQYKRDCEDKGKTPTSEEHLKLAGRRPKEPSIEEIEKLCLWADIIVVMRRDTRNHVALMMAIKDLKKPLIFETDDFVHYVPPYNPGAKYYVPGTEQTDIWSSKQFDIADYVQVTTPGLKRLYTQLHRKIHIIPNAFDSDYWVDKYPESKPHKGEVWIGWSGANAHWGDLRRLREVITPVLDKYPQAKFHFVGQLPEWWYDDKNKGRVVVHKFRNLSTYAEYLHSLNFDIGVAPLCDNLFNRGKSNIRWIEYSVNKTATVASPIFAYNDDPQGIMKNYKNVIYAKEKNDWIRVLSELIEDETLRKKIADQAYKDAFEYYSLEKVAPLYAKTYQEIYDDFHYKKSS